MMSESISVVKVGGVLLVTVPEDPDDGTVSLLQQNILARMEKHGAQALILDISLVETLDSFFARTIIETSSMVQLMGGDTIIAGMHPSVAITATQLGLDFGGVQTTLSVDRALARLQRS